MIKVQLGGKFTREDDGIFLLKKKLKESGHFSIRYPEGDGIMADHNGIPLTFDPAKEKKSFYEVELDFMLSIKESDFHIVYNKFAEKIGYIGESSSIEIAYGLVHDKNIVLMHQPLFSDKVPESIKNLISVAVQKEKILVIPLYTYNLTEIDNFVHDYKSYEVKYSLSVTQEMTVLQEVEKLLLSYKNANF